MEEKGLYKELYENTELVDKEEALAGNIRINANNEVTNTVNGSYSYSIINSSGSNTSTKYYCKFIGSISNPQICAVCGKPLVYHK